MRGARVQSDGRAGGSVPVGDFVEVQVGHRAEQLSGTRPGGMSCVHYARG